MSKVTDVPVWARVTLGASIHFGALGVALIVNPLIDSVVVLIASVLFFGNTSLYGYQMVFHPAETDRANARIGDVVARIRKRINRK